MYVYKTYMHIWRYTKILTDYIIIMELWVQANFYALICIYIILFNEHVIFFQIKLKKKKTVSSGFVLY